MIYEDLNIPFIRISLKLSQNFFNFDNEGFKFDNSYDFASLPFIIGAAKPNF